MKTLQVKHISISILCNPIKVYQFASNPTNLCLWATGLSSSVQKVGNDWIAQSPLGKIKIKFAKANPFGILDHHVILESGNIFLNPMRVIPNQEGSEVIFSLFRQPEMSEEQFKQDADWVTKDLLKLKSILEK